MRVLFSLALMLGWSISFLSPAMAIQEESAKGQTAAAEATVESKAKSDDDQKEKKKVEKLVASHKQTRNFRPRHKGESINLHTFCVNSKGQLLALVGGTTMQQVFEDGELSIKSKKRPAILQVYSHEQKLVDEIPLAFDATAINIDRDDTVYLAGDGQVAKLDSKLEIVKTISSPSLKDESELKDLIKKQLAEQFELYTKSTKTQMERIEKQIEKIKDIDEEERSKIQVRRLKTFERQLESMKQSQQAMASMYKPTDERIEQSMKQAKEIRSLAINDQDVYVTCAAPGTYGYEIWRVNKSLEDPERVLEDVSGCCGQMDIQARGEHLYVAENTKFRVAVYDRDGKEVSKFGSRAAGGSQAGFGSCCNPMNIRCCSNGEVLAAESSIGNIKRYDANGKLIGFIGRAKIGGGCKHVAIGHDTVHDIYYMMYQDESSICVLEPAEKVGVTKAEKSAAEAAAGLGKKVIGKWTLVSDKADADKKKDAKEGEEKEEEENAGGAISVDALTAFKSVEFKANGKLDYKLASDIGFAWDLSFKPTKQEGDTLWMDLVDGEDIIMMSMKVKFVGDDKIESEVSYASMPPTKSTFERK